MSNFYFHSLPQPFHLSVGAVLFNEKYEICVHHLYTEKIPERLKFLMGDLPDGHILMRESLEVNETLHECVSRGLEEEFGAKGVIEKYLGPLLCTVKTPTTEFEKTTLYHAVRLTELGERTGTDEESNSVMEWYAPEQLLKLFEQQAKNTDREELAEAVIINRFIESYGI